MDVAHTEQPGPDGPPPAATGNTPQTTVELVEELSELARTLQAQADSGKLLDEIIAAAVSMIPGADGGSISVVVRRHHQVTSQRPTGDLPRLVDALQSEVGEGPCLDAVFDHPTVRVPDLSREQRWPRFAARAAALGAGSMLSFRLFVKDDDLGALNLYSHRPHAFDEESERVGLLFASHAAVAFAQAKKLDQFAIARDNRDLIGQAKGILMERYRIGPVPAFALLVAVSQHSNRKLLDVADEIAVTGEFSGLDRLSKAAGAAAPV